MQKKSPIIQAQFLLLLVFLLVGSSGASDKPAASSIPNVKEISLGRVPEGYKVISSSIKYCQDMRHVSYVAYSDKTHKIVRVNDETSPVYYAVQPGTPFFTPNKYRYGYIAYKDKNGDAVVTVDGQPSPVVTNADNLTFSPDESRYAYRAVKDKKFFAVVDGIPGSRYEGIVVKNNFKFSPDSKHFIYVAFKNNNCILVYDGKEEKNTFNFIKDVSFSPDSNHYAYKARTEKRGNLEKWCVVKDGIPGTIYDMVFDLIFSYDSKHLAYVAIKDRQMVLVLDGKEIATHDRIGIPLFSLDSKMFTYAFAEKNNWHVAINDSVSPSYDQVYKLSFSYDSKRYSYTVQDNEKWFCIVDGKKGPGFEKGVDAFRFSPDSSRYAYAGIDNDSVRIITDGAPGRSYKSVGETYFSFDSKHTVYRASKKTGGKWQTVLDGKEYANPYYAIGKYYFSPNSKHLAFSAFKNINETVMVVDGEEQCANYYFKILGEPFFSPDSNNIVYYAMNKKEKWRLAINGKALPESYDGFFKETPIVFDSPTHFHTIALKDPGPGFVLIEVDIPENIKLETELQ